MAGKSCHPKCNLKGLEVREVEGLKFAACNSNLVLARGAMCRFANSHQHDVV